MITTLPERISALPDALRAACERIFAVRREHGSALPPREMEPWVREQFGEVDAVREQTVVRVTNRLTLEASLINPLRARRSTSRAVDDAELEAWIAEELRGADFADPLRRTPADVFGRIEGRFCVSASNVAKYDGWHGLVVFGEGNPLRFTREHLADYLDVALRWVAAAHARDAEAIYPIITWNCLPKSGASIVHGHMQVALARGIAHARPELWRRAVRAYASETGRAYCDDLFTVHAALGLALHDGGGARSFAHLSPLRNREVVALLEPLEGPEGWDRCGVGASPVPLAARLADVLDPVLRGLIERQGVRALNLGVALPPLGPADEEWAGFPVVARVCDRGAPLTVRNDWAAMELYGTSVITADPFDAASALRSFLAG